MRGRKVLADGRHQQAHARRLLDPALSQGITFAGSPARLPAVPEGGSVLRRRLAVLLVLTACGSWQRVGDSPDGRLRRRPSPASSTCPRSIGRWADWRPGRRCRSSARSSSPPGRGIPSRRSSGSRSRTGPSPSRRTAATSSRTTGSRCSSSPTRTPADPLRARRAGAGHRLQGDAAERRERAVPAAVSPEGRATTTSPCRSATRPARGRPRRTPISSRPISAPASFSAPILAYQVTGRRHCESRTSTVVLSPRGTVSYGGDTLLASSRATTTPKPTTVPFEVIDEQDSVILRDTLRFTGARRGRVPGRPAGAGQPAAGRAAAGGRRAERTRSRPSPWSRSPGPGS